MSQTWCRLFVAIFIDTRLLGARVLRVSGSSERANKIYRKVQKHSPREKSRPDIPKENHKNKTARHTIGEVKNEPEDSTRSY